MQELSNDVRMLGQTVYSGMMMANMMGRNKPSQKPSANQMNTNQKNYKKNLKKFLKEQKWRTDGAEEIFGLQPFTFTGSETDLSFFYLNDKLNVSVINNLPDKTLSNCVKNTFENSLKKKHITVSDGVITLTRKGKKYISSKGFKEQAKFQQRTAFNSFGASNEIQRPVVEEEKKTVTLTGTEKDISIFNSADGVDVDSLLCQVENPSNRLFFRQSFKAMEHFDYIRQQENGKFVLTEKGKAFLESGKTESLPIKKETVIVEKPKPTFDLNGSMTDIFAFKKKSEINLIDYLQSADLPNGRKDIEKIYSGFDMLQRQNLVNRKGDIYSLTDNGKQYMDKLEKLVSKYEISNFSEFSGLHQYFLNSDISSLPLKDLDITDFADAAAPLGDEDFLDTIKYKFDSMVDSGKMSKNPDGTYRVNRVNVKPQSKEVVSKAVNVTLNDATLVQNPKLALFKTAGKTLMQNNVFGSNNTPTLMR